MSPQTIPYWLASDPELQDQQQMSAQAPPVQMAAPPPAMSAAPVNPHDTLTTPIGPPAPEPAPMMAGKAPAKESAPKMSANDQIEEHEQGRLMSDYKKDADPYGSPDNHPGFFGKLLHGLNVATGGVNRRGMEEKGIESGIEGLEKQKSEEGLENANAGHLNAETPEVAPNAESMRAEQAAQAKNTESETAARDQTTAQGPNLVMGHAHAVNQALAQGRDPATDPIVQAYEDAMTRTQPQKNPEGGPKTIQIEEGGKPHQMAWDTKTGKYDLDQGESGEKPASIRVETPGEQRGAKNDLLKAYQPALDSSERMNVMTDAYEKAVKNHDQQAMANLLFNHLGMTMGLQKGARMTKDIIHEAQQSQPWLQGVAAKFDKDGYLSGVTLSQPQMRQMVDLARERYGEDTRKARSTAQYLSPGSKDDGPQRVPSDSTIRYFKGLAGGNGAKAKELAAQDGWSVQ